MSNLPVYKAETIEELKAILVKLRGNKNREENYWKSSCLALECASDSINEVMRLEGVMTS